MNRKKMIRISTAPRAALVAAGCLVLIGCQSQSQQPAGLLASNDYSVRHPIVVTEAPETLDLPLGRNTRRLSGPIVGTISSFAKDSRQQGNGAVEILVPSGGANEAAVHAVTPQIRKALQQGGVSRSRISTRTYPVQDASADAPIRLSYPRMQATAGECGNWPDNIGGHFNKNVDYENYGCATQANLAAMVANPSDLLTPRASTPADQARRANVIENYRKGDITASDYVEGVGAEIAEQ